MAESEDKMTDEEAIEIVRKEKAYMDSHAGRAQSEAFSMAIKALEKQEKIKDLLDSCTAYPDDMCDCLVEIEKILRSDEE